MLDEATPETSSKRTPTMRIRPKRAFSIRRLKARHRLNRRENRAPVSPDTLRLIGKIEAGGKWLASASGVAIGLGVALMITAYGALLPNFNDCLARHTASQSIQRGRQLVIVFTACALSGMIAGTLPNLIAVAKLMWRRSRSDSSQVVRHDLYWMRQLVAEGVLLCQVLPLAFGAVLFGIGLTFVIDVASQQTPDNLDVFASTFLVACGAPPPP